MKVRFASVVLLTMGLGWTALAQGPSPMREGSWEYSMKINIPGMEGAPPMKQTQCVTAAMLKDPASAMPRGPGSGDCKMTDYKLAGSTATYTMTCTQPAPITMTGEMKYASADAYTGTIKVDMGGGQTMAMDIDAKRIGECAK